MINKKIKVGVLMGGPSAEREVSLVTGKAVCANLDRTKYLVTAVEMAKDGRFFVLPPHQRGPVVAGRNKKKRWLDLQNDDRKLFDVIFIAMHGSVGEDGAVQGMLESWGIPYTGSG